MSASSPPFRWERRKAGIAVPQSALLMGEGESWVYVENADNHFLRTRIDTAKPTANGYFLAPGTGIKAGDKIVTRGAGLHPVPRNQSQHRRRGLTHALAWSIFACAMPAPWRL